MQSDVIRKNDPECCPVLIDKNDTQDLVKCEDAAPDAIKKCEGGIPNIRFRGFTDDWEERKLGELGEIATGSTPSTSNSTYYSENGIPWVTPTDINALTISNTPRKLSEEGEKVGRVVPANTILCTCIASIGKNTLLTVKGSFNQQINSLTPYDENDAYFLLTESEVWSNTMKRMAASGTMQIVNKAEFSELRTMVPSLAEQQQVGTYFKRLDNLITLHQRKYDETRELKKYMLQKMFPKNGEKVPEIRFRGFTGEWEQRKFGEFYEVNNERNKDLIGYDKTFSIATMTYKDEGNGAADSSLKTYKVLRIGDIAFEGHTNKEFRYGRFVANDVGDGIISPRFSTLRPINEMPVSFWKHYIHYEPVMRKKLVCSTKAGTMMNELVTSDFFEQEIAVPCIEEQRQIGTFLNYLDHLIALHQRKCDELKELKQYMLQNMFPQKI